MPLAFDRQRVCKTGTDTAAMEAERRESDAGSTRTVASLCRGERTLGIAEGSHGSEAQLGDDDFARFIGHLSREAMPWRNPVRSEEHTSELLSLMRISYAVFSLKKKKT